MNMKGAQMQISNININLIAENAGLIAFASMVIDEKIRINGIGIHKKSDSSGYRLTYPTRKTGQKSNYLFHPISHETSALIEKAVFIKLKTVLEGCHDRHDCTHARSKRI